MRSYPESETKVFRTIYRVPLTFIKDDKEERGEIALVIIQQLLRKQIIPCRQPRLPRPSDQPDYQPWVGS